MTFVNGDTTSESRVALRTVAPIPPLARQAPIGSVVGGAERFARGGTDTDQEPAGGGSPLLRLVHRAGLTSRDLQVLRFLSEGWTTAEIARELVYAESTIKKEVHIIVQRLGARNRTHAVAMAVRGLVI